MAATMKYSTEFVQETPALLKLAVEKIEAGQIKTAIWMLIKISAKLEQLEPAPIVLKPEKETAI